MSEFEQWVNQTVGEFAARIQETSVPAWVKTRQIHAVRNALEASVSTVEMYEAHEQVDTH